VVNGVWLLAAACWLLAGHPTHTSGAELSAERDGTVRVVLRVFADDFAAALASGSTVPPSPAVSGYLRDRFTLLDPAGKPIELAWQAGPHTGDVLLLHARGHAAGGLAGSRVTSRVLTDRFADEVNVVRATYGGRSATLIFVRGDGAKPLP
jgi:hypothetical protein